MNTLLQNAIHILKHRTGVVIPIYVPEGVDADRATLALRDTLTAYCEQVADPATICLSVDGEECGADLARDLAETFNTSISVAPVNRGKLNGARNGARALLENTELQYIAIVDQDGDHFANELLNFVRAALHITEQTGDDRVMILGQRLSRHHSMGLLRGEFEELADRILLEALTYHAAIHGTPLRLEYATLIHEFPDFHSGYKLFDRGVAERVFLSPPQPVGTSDICYYRHAVEAVMTVEALLHGARLGLVNRTTFNEQPISTFGLLNHDQVTADLIIWPCKRLGVPLTFVKQWLANHSARLLLNTLAPAGKEELMRVRQIVLTAMGDTDQEPVPDLRPRFV